MVGGAALYLKPPEDELECLGRTQRAPAHLRRNAPGFLGPAQVDAVPRTRCVWQNLARSDSRGACACAVAKGPARPRF